MMARTWIGGPLEVPDLTLHDYLLTQMATFAEKPCIIDKGTEKSYTFNEMTNVSRSVANGLTKLGVKQGDIIAFYKLNSATFVAMVLGGLAAGATVCTINPASTVFELKHYMTDVKPDFVFTEPALLSKITETVEATGQKVTIISSGEDKVGDEVLVSTLLSEPGDVIVNAAAGKVNPRTTAALILFSSGTTGLPKGVLLSHRNVVANLVAMLMRLPEGAEIGVISFPMYHAAGLICECMSRLASGQNQIMFPRFEFEKYLQAIETHKPMTLMVPPPLIVLMAKSPLAQKYDLSCLRQVICGAGAVKKELEDEFKARLGNPVLAQGYGMTEVTSAALAKDLSQGNVKPGSVGTIFPGSEAKVVDPTTGELLGPNKTGEIYMRGEQTMMGYLNRPEATADTLDGDGWIHSGDLGYFDEDGHFYVVDRIKELIKYKAFQVAPAELDAIILEMPEVADVAVIGMLDELAGELPRAYVVKQANSQLTEQQVADYVAERVSYYKKLRGGVVFTDAIPKLPSGKILRRKLRDMANAKTQ